MDAPAGAQDVPQHAGEGAATRVLAGNQGLYNGFLAAGIGVGLAMDEPVLVTFALCCVVAAGVYGAWSVNRRIFYIQALPAILALVLRSL